MTPDRRAALVGRDNTLNRLLGRVDELNRLLEDVRRAAPPEIAPYLQAVAWSGLTLMVAVPNSAVASRLRMSAPTILTKLQASNWQASAIRAKVQVDLQVQKPNGPKNLHMTDEAMDAFSDLAGAVEDPGLRTALQALLRHHGRKS